jgi:hypothetical protein
MFRDESSKVIQRAHAQWGVSDSLDGAGPSRASPSPSSASPSTQASANQGSGSPAEPGASRLSFPAPPNTGGTVTTGVVREISATRVDQAIHYYIEHYILGHPDEPKDGPELSNRRWLHTPMVRDAMAAVGLASTANLTGDKELHRLANEKYGLALQRTAASIQNVTGLDFEMAVRTIIKLAMFEVSKAIACS